MMTAKRADVEIQKDVLEELDWDPEVEATEVGVEVDDGVVTLTGWVGSHAKKLAAERAAQRVEGVRAVANDLSVRSAMTRTDTDIAKAAAGALEANSAIPRDRIEVTVKNGKITLTGHVDWEHQRTAAIETVRGIEGVRDVICEIAVERPHVSAADVKAEIDRAFVHSAELDAERIEVHVKDGQVTLTGTVRTWAEKRQAIEAAMRVRGVTEVTNLIEVERPWG
jgi:osmotically-inducible protein OsmY